MVFARNSAAIYQCIASSQTSKMDCASLDNILCCSDSDGEGVNANNIAIDGDNMTDPGGDKQNIFHRGEIRQFDAEATKFLFQLLPHECAQQLLAHSLTLVTMRKMSELELESLLPLPGDFSNCVLLRHNLTLWKNGLETANMSAQHHSTEKAKAIIRGWGLSPNVLQWIEDHLITDTALKLLNDHDMERLLPLPGQFNDRVKFPTQLEKWRANERIISTCSPMELESPQPTKVLKKLDTILNETIKGRILLDLRGSNGLSRTLCDEEQSTLVDLIACDIMDPSFCVVQKRPTICDFYAQEIVRLFPVEDKHTYFLPRSGKRQPSGKLYNRRLVYSKYVTKKKSKAQSTVSETETLSDGNTQELTLSLEEMKADKFWLFDNFTTWEQIKDRWKRTYILRKKE